MSELHFNLSIAESLTLGVLNEASVAMDFGILSTEVPLYLNCYFIQ